MWSGFADSIPVGYSPLYSAVAMAVANDRELLSLVDDAPPPAHFPPTLLAAVHYLLLDGLDHPLGAVYRGESDAPAVPLFRDLCLTQRDRILELLEVRRVQTNEVGRSSLIGPALTWVAAHHGAPVQLVDVGCSAGLNMLCDRYRLDYGERGHTGPDDAVVRVDCRVVGGNPPIAPRLPEVVGRIGIDLDPPDLRDPADARWLLACVWPDTGRLERTARAIGEAIAEPPPVRAGDAVALLPDVLDELGPGLAVVVTTWSYAYVLPDQRPAFIDALRRTGRSRPLVWIAAEARGLIESVDLSSVAEPPASMQTSPVDVLSAWRFDGAGDEARILALVHSHGLWIDWRA